MTFGTHAEGNLGERRSATAPMKVVPSCPRCARVLAPGDGFCASCGDPVQVHWVPMPACGSCGAANPVDFRFCVECGVGRPIGAATVDAGEDTMNLQGHLSLVPDAPPLWVDEDSPTDLYVRVPSEITGAEPTCVCTRPGRPTTTYRRRS